MLLLNAVLLNLAAVPFLRIRGAAIVEGIASEEDI